MHSRNKITVDILPKKDTAASQEKKLVWTKVNKYKSYESTCSYNDDSSKPKKDSLHGILLLPVFFFIFYFFFVKILKGQWE